MANPFSVEIPAEFKRFVNHKLLISYLIGLWRDYPNMPIQSAAIWGKRGSGKTSLLKHLEHLHDKKNRERLSEEHQKLLEKLSAIPIIFVYADMSDFALNSKVKLLRRLSRNQPFLQNPNNIVDDFYDFIRKEENPIVFLLDNVDRGIEYYPSEFDRDLWEMLRSLVTNKSNIGFVIASEGTPASIQQLFGGRSSDFFNAIGYTFKIEEAFTEEDARELIDLSDEKFSQEDTRFILEKSKRIPRLLQKLCWLRYEHLSLNADWQEKAEDFIKQQGIKNAEQQNLRLQQERRRTLHDLLRDHFDFGEIKTIVFLLMIPNDELDETTKTRLIETLIVYCEKQNYTENLVAVMKEQRPLVVRIQGL